MARTPSPPYTSVSDVDAFFQRVETIAEPKPPKKVDSDWVKGFGFETAHHSAIPSMLRWLGVINDENESTGIWNELRVDATREAALQRLLQESYKGVFETVDVEQASTRDLRGAFVHVYSIGNPGRQIKCFLALCRHAGISTAEEATARETAPSDRKAKPTSRRDPKSSSAKAPARRTVRSTELQSGLGMTVVLNVEIPASWSENDIQQRIHTVTKAITSAHESGGGDS